MRSAVSLSKAAMLTHQVRWRGGTVADAYYLREINNPSQSSHVKSGRQSQVRADHRVSLKKKPAVLWSSRNELQQFPVQKKCVRVFADMVSPAARLAGSAIHWPASSIGEASESLPRQEINAALATWKSRESKH